MLRRGKRQAAITTEPFTYIHRGTKIVGDLEADIKLNRIAVSSPIARAMIGKEEGDVAVVEAPGGTRELEIVEIEFI